MVATNGARQFEGTYPAPDIRAIIDKTALHIGKKADGRALEAKIRLRSEADARFKFLNPEDAYHAYYTFKLEEARTSDAAAASQQQPTTVTGRPSMATMSAADLVSGPAADVIDDGRPQVPRPGDFEFLMDQPSANPVDLDILRMTALFAARNGRKFQTDLAQREATNYQFDFLQPSHSLFGYYNRLVAQYVKVLQPDELHLERLALKAAPADASASRKADARREILREVADRVQWDRWTSERSKKAEADAESRRRAYAEIDWQDFVVVTTVEFTEADDLLDLPPPMLLEEVETMSMRQRRMAAMIMEGKEVMPDEDEAAEVMADANAAAEDMQVDSDDEAPAPAPVPVAVPTAADIRTADSAATMKIRSDYVPKSQRAKKVATTLCNICGLQIPEDEINEHIRIELLDPRWKEKQAVTERNRSAANLLPGGSNVTEALNKFARQRSDLFGSSATTEAQKRALVEEEARLRKQREAVVWDGHAVSADLTSTRFRDAALAGQGDLQEQIRALRRAHGVNVDSPSAPDIGPAAPGAAERRAAAAEAERQLIAAYNAAAAGPQARPPTVEPHIFAGATLSAAPNPTLQSVGPSVVPEGAGLPNAPEAYQGGAGPAPGMSYGAQQQAMATDPSMLPPIHMTGVGGPSQPLPPISLGTRAAEGAPDGEPAAKRSRTAGGQLVPEADWLASHPHPISVYVQLPTLPDKPEWKCDGSRIILADLPSSMLCGQLRDRIQQSIGLPIGKQKLQVGPRVLGANVTLAALNIEHGEVITLSVRK